MNFLHAKFECLDDKTTPTEILGHFHRIIRSKKSNKCLLPLALPKLIIDIFKETLLLESGSFFL